MGRAVRRKWPTAGVAVLPVPELRGGDPWSIVEMLLTAICYAVAPQIAARRLGDVPALPMTAVCLGLAALVYTPPAIMTWPRPLPPAQVLVALAGLAVVCTALAFTVFFALIREAGPTRAAPARGSALDDRHVELAEPVGVGK